jgi:hypothetical protein
MNNPHARNVGISLGTLLAGSTTLVCCVLPAALVSLGAGAAVVGLVSTFPQLIWLSEHKGIVFGIAAGFLAVSGVLLWRARALPCPTDPDLAKSCTRLRRVSYGLYAVSLAFVLLGATDRRSNGKCVAHCASVDVGRSDAR